MYFFIIKNFKPKKLYRSNYILIYMLVYNNIYNASALSDCQQTLDVVADKVSFMGNKFRKWIKISLNGVKNTNCYLRRVLSIYRRK